MSISRLRSVVLSLLAISLAVGCEEGTTLVVDLRTDLSPGQEFMRVRTEYSTEGFESAAASRQQVETLAVDDADYVLRGSRIASFDGLRPGAAFVRVSLLDEAGEVVVDRVVTAAVRQRAVMVVVVSRSCRGIECPGESDDPGSTTCLAGRCVPPECTTEDPGACGTQSCSSDADCGADAPCAEGMCLESECFFVGLDTRCASDEWCDADRGCRPRDGIERDGGTPDAGMTCAPTETGCATDADEDCDGLFGCEDPDCSGASCDDGSTCTTDDVCGTEGCGGTAIDCDDGNPCTADACDGALGCTHEAAPGSCDDGSACTTDDQCVDTVCTGTALPCDDGNACTTDTCDPALGCVQTNNTDACDDGFFCNGADTCQDGACTVHGAPPCAAFCNETTETCDQCFVDADCGTVTTTAWSPATCGWAGTCDEAAPARTRQISTPRCMTGMCTVVTTTESSACSRNTDGTVCFTSAGTCAYAGACDESQQRTPIRRVCAAGVCPSSGGAQTATTSGCATRNTDGNSCGSRTRDRCCAGACRDIWSSEAHCGGCSQQCESGLTCRIIHSGATAGDGAECYGPCTANAQCDAPGGSRNCYPVSSGGLGYCQCLDNSGCAAGQTCAVVSGTNYCRY